MNVSDTGPEPPAAAEEPPSQRLAFPDNRLALSLFGECDAHLKLVEARLGVVVHPLGNGVVISPLAEREAAPDGPDAEARADARRVEQARQLLESLYRGLEQGRTVDRPVVEAALLALDEAGEAASPARVLSDDGPLHTPLHTPRRTIFPRTPRQAAYMRILAASDMTFAIGPAGTGKTYLAVAAAVNAFLDGHVARIVLTRPAVEAGERLGFLPGDLQAKVDPYLRPLYDALYDMLGFERVERMVVRNELEIAPLAYMRGRTLEEAFIILDEAQNTTSEQMKMFLTRLGEGSRAAVAGDVTQVDLPRGRISGLVEAVRLLAGLEEVAFVHFTHRDVVRHGLVRKIVRAYEQAALERSGED